MRNRFFIPMAMTLSVMSLSAQQISFTVNGQIDNIADGTIISVLGRNGNGYMPLSVDTVYNGHFNFDIITDQAPDMGGIIMVNQRRNENPYLMIYLEDGCHLDITGSGYNPLGWIVKSDVKAQNTESEINNGTADFSMQLKRLYREQSALERKLRDAHLPPQRRKEIEDSLSCTTFNLRSIDTTIQWMQLSRLKELPVDDAWMHTFAGMAYKSATAYPYIYTDELKELYKRIPPEYLCTFDGEHATAYLFPPEIIDCGEKIPETELETPYGCKVKLSDFKGKHLLIDFWSTGCGGCLHYMPEMTAIASEYGDRLQVLSVNLDTRQMWNVGTEIFSNPVGNCRDPKGKTGLFELLGLKGTPSYAIVSPDGTLLDKWFNGVDGTHREHLDRHISRKQQRCLGSEDFEPPFMPINAN